MNEEPETVWSVAFKKWGDPINDEDNAAYFNQPTKRGFRAGWIAATLADNDRKVAYDELFGAADAMLDWLRTLHPSDRPIAKFNRLMDAVVGVREAHQLDRPTIAAAMEGRESLQPLPDFGSETQDGDVIIPGAYYRTLLSRAQTAEQALAEAREEIEELKHPYGDMPLCRHGVGIFGDRIKCDACTAEYALADKTTALNTAEAEAFELRRLADGMAERLKETADCRLALPNCGGGNGYRCCHARQALAAYAAHIAQVGKGNMIDWQDEYDETVLAPLRARLATEENRSRYAEERLAAARARIAQLEAEAAWRPIESALRDGTRIEVRDDDGVTAAHWCPCQESWTEVPYNNEERCGFTHWRPLPPAPEG